MFFSSLTRNRLTPLAQRFAVGGSSISSTALRATRYQIRPTFSSPRINSCPTRKQIRPFTNSSKDSANNATSSGKTFLEKFLGPKEIPPKGTLAWYGEMVLICTVFAITGTTTMMMVRPVVKNALSLEGNFKDGPWAYRISTLVIMSPLYSVLLVVVGTVFGR